MTQLVSAAAYSRERDDGQNEVTFPSHSFIRISSGLNYSFWQPYILLCQERQSKRKVSFSIKN